MKKLKELKKNPKKPAVLMLLTNCRIDVIFVFSDENSCRARIGFAFEFSSKPGSCKSLRWNFFMETFYSKMTILLQISAASEKINLEQTCYKTCLLESYLPYEKKLQKIISQI